MRVFCLFCAIAALSACGSRENSGLDALETRTVVLPGGEKIRAEVKIRPQEMSMGMMFRDSLPRGQGMLFIHSKPGPYTYWMHNCRIPLDIIFMDPEHKILGIAENAPPCTAPPDQCPRFGGAANTQFVLELAGGESKHYGLKPGQTLSF